MRHRVGLRIAASAIMLLSITPTAGAHDWDFVEDIGSVPQMPEQYLEDEAVVLFDRGTAIWKKKELRFKRYRRLQILSPADSGTAQAVSLQIADYDHLVEFKGRVLGGDGREVEVGKEALERIERGDMVFFDYRFDEVRPGDVVEWFYDIEYYGGYDYLDAQKLLVFVQRAGGISPSMRSHLEAAGGGNADNYLERQIRNLPTWYFDCEFFTLASSLEVELFTDLKFAYYAANLTGEEAKPAVEGRFLHTGRIYKWELANVPPFDLTGGVGHQSGARTAVYFNLTSSGYGTGISPAMYPEEYWSDVGTELRGYVHAYSDRTRKLRNKANDLVKGELNQREKVTAVYDFVASEYGQPEPLIALRPLNWNVGNMFKNREGAAFEVNLLLTEMLKSTGVSAKPVFLSVADGLSFKQRGMFDHAIVLVDLDGEAIFLDASTGICGAGELPAYVGSNEGLVIGDDSLWICTVSSESCPEPITYLESLIP